MKRFFYINIILAIILATNFAQTPGGVVWKLITPDSLRVSVIEGNLEAADAVGNSFTVRDYTGGAGPLGSSQRWWPGSGVSWGNETTQVNSRYIEFTVNPKPGYEFMIDSISLYLGGGGTSGMRANLYYSTSSGFESPVLLNSGGPLTLLNGSVQQFFYGIGLKVAATQKFYFRIYPYYTAAVATTGKYLYVQNVVMKGTVKEGSLSTQLSVSTTNVTNVSHNSASAGGYINSDGGDPVTARGVCWNNSGTPTISDAKTNDGGGLGAFTSIITGLKPLTKYYVRAYALNSQGTAYGEEINFPTPSEPLPAFPTAEGYGKYTVGGRGGKLYEVTNLNDDNNPGSLRYAINQSGPRTIVFRVSGTIHLKSSLSIKNGYLTIAGQTAPGDGICIAGFTPSIDADNVIVRFIRFRLGDLNLVENDAFNGRNRKDIIIDHCSMSWSVDEVSSFYDNKNFTMQWCIIGESLYNSAHEKGAHGYGGIQGGMGATFHHNLYIHNTSRNPRFCGARYHTSTYTTEIVDFVNNVIYNWGSNSIYGGELGQQNVRSNYFKPGPATKSSVRNRILNPSTSSDPVAGYGKFYVADNYVFGYPNTTLDNWTTGVQGVTEQIKKSVRVDAPFPIADVKTHSAEQAFQAVMSIAGANFPKRDAVDARLIQETISGTATFEGTTYKLNNSIPDPSKISGIIDSQKDVGGWPELVSAVPPADTDHDGMPDNWETARGLNSNDPSDGSKTSITGYTNLEDYLNELVSSVVTGVKREAEELPSEIELSQNYPNPFNSSTTIQYKIPVVEALSGAGVHVSLKVYDVLGREITTIVDEVKTPGTYKVVFDTRQASINPPASGRHSMTSGIYFYRITAGNYSETKKLILLK